MKYHITQIKSSNWRPADHPEFLGDERTTPDILNEEDFSSFLVEWLPTYLAQGDVVEIRASDRSGRSTEYRGLGPNYHMRQNDERFATLDDGSQNSHLNPTTETLRLLNKPLTPIELAELFDAVSQTTASKEVTMRLRRLIFQYQSAKNEQNQPTTTKQ
jgi:hypothetical protein